MNEQRIRKIRRQLQESRFRLVNAETDFSMPLYEIIFVATKDVTRISTNGKCIYFDPDWLQKLGNTELDFILSHQLMHIALGHIDRPQYFKGDRFHLAADIVANANLHTLGWQYEKLPHIGKIFYKTFFPRYDGRELTAQEAMNCVPFDPATMSEGSRRQYMIDSEQWWDRKADRGEFGTIVLSPEDADPEDLQLDGISYGGHYKFKREIYYEQELDGSEEESMSDSGKTQSQSKTSWDKSAVNELQSLRSMKKKNEEEGIEGDFAERLWQRTNRAGLDWKRLLDSFIQEEVFDYSFTPPDRRMQDSEFFLPDYNVLVEKPKEVLFMVDTSGSVNEEMLSAVYGEICKALEQFNGGLTGILAFFDTGVYTPTMFSDIEELKAIIPHGGGGTSYKCIFDYVRNNMQADPPASIVVFTDGEADFPDETMAENIPVLWLFTTDKAVAPWGRSARVKI